MKKIGREALLKQLDLVAPGLSSREIIEQSTCFVFKGGKVHTFNDEVSCHAPCELDGLEGAVQASTFLELLKRMPEDEIQVEWDSAEIRLIGSRRRGGLTLENEITLPVDLVELPEEWQDLPSEFVTAVKLVRECAGTDASKFNLTCLHFTNEFVEACDNHQLARYTLEMNLKEEALIRKATVAPIIELEPMQYAETKSWLHFRCVSGMVLSTRRFFEDDYPNLTPLLDVEGVPATLSKGIAVAADTARIFSAENADEDKTRVLVKLKGGMVQIEGRGPGGWYQERKKINYDGPAIQFLITAKLLQEITGRFPDCELTEDRLKIHNGPFIYVASLGKVRD